MSVSGLTPLNHPRTLSAAEINPKSPDPPFPHLILTHAPLPSVAPPCAPRHWGVAPSEWGSRDHTAPDPPSPARWPSMPPLAALRSAALHKGAGVFGGPPTQFAAARLMSTPPLPGAAIYFSDEVAMVCGARPACPHAPSGVAGLPPASSGVRSAGPLQPRVPPSTLPRPGLGPSPRAVPQAGAARPQTHTSRLPLPAGVGRTGNGHQDLRSVALCIPEAVP